MISEWSQVLNDVATSYPNIRINRIDPEKLVLETPVESLWFGDRVARSKYFVSHLRFDDQPNLPLPRILFRGAQVDQNFC